MDNKATNILASLDSDTISFIASHGCKSKIVSLRDNKIVLQHGNINYLVLHFHHFTSITITATTKTAINSTNDISFRTIFCLKKKSTTNRTARATNNNTPINLLIIFPFRCFFATLIFRVENCTSGRILWVH